MTVDPNYPDLLDGPGIGLGSSGGPVWTLTAVGKPQVVGVISSQYDNGSAFFARLTHEDVRQIQDWVKQDDAGLTPPTPVDMASVLIHDQTTGGDLPDTGLSQPYVGPVDYLKTQIIDLSPDNLNITLLAPNTFIHTAAPAPIQST